MTSIGFFGFASSLAASTASAMASWSIGLVASAASSEPLAILGRCCAFCASLPPRDRLRRYLDLITGKLAHDGFTRGCLIGDFSLEASGSSEMLREQLDEIFREWRAPFAACIAEAQAAREIASDFDADELADFLLASWQGAMLRMKVERSAAALERFKTIAFQTVFKELP